MEKILFLFILFMGSTALKSENFTISNYHVDLIVSKEGYFDVEETIDVNFIKMQHGIIWKIPYRYIHQGKNRILKFDNVQVIGHDFFKSIEGRNIKLRIGNKNKFVDGNQRYVIKYRVFNAFKINGTQQKLHWNLVGKGWDVPIESISYKVFLPEKPKLNKSDYSVYTRVVSN